MSERPAVDRRARRPTAIELCCGAGGMALGFERAGFDVLAAVELDPVHLAAHERNFPLCEPICADVAEVSGKQVLVAARRGWRRRHQSSRLASVDCVFGGPSCQGFSVIGARNAEDPRNALVAEFARLVGEIRPRWFVMENVPGLISGAYRAVLSDLYAAMKAHGYDVADPWIINARDFGVPQDRKRVFVVGARSDARVPAMPTSDGSKVTVAEALDDLRTLSRFTSLRHCDALTLNERQLAAMRNDQSDYVRSLHSNGAGADLADAREWDPFRITSVGLTAHSDDVITRFRSLRPGDRDKVARLPKLDSVGQSPTLRAGTGRDHGSFTSARPVHHRSARVITVREAARLHGFPDWFGFHATKWQGFRQVGNAVPPPLARAVAAQVVAAGRLIPPPGRQTPRQLGDNELLEATLTEAADRYGLPREKLPHDVRRASSTTKQEAA